MLVLGVCETSPLGDGGSGVVSKPARNRSWTLFAFQ